MRLLIAVAAAGSVLGSAFVHAMYLPAPGTSESAISDIQVKKRKGRWQGQRKGGAKKMKKGEGSPKGPKCFNACVAKGKSAKACNSRCD